MKKLQLVIKSIVWIVWLYTKLILKKSIDMLFKIVSFIRRHKGGTIISVLLVACLATGVITVHITDDVRSLRSDVIRLQQENAVMLGELSERAKALQADRYFPDEVVDELPPVSEEEDSATSSEVASVSYTEATYYTDLWYDESCPLSYEQQHEAYTICNEYGISYALFMGMIETESGFDPDAVSDTSDYGLCQINQCNIDWLSSELGLTDIMDPIQNMKAGAYLLSYYQNKYVGPSDGPNVLMMIYNMGPSGAKCQFAQGSYSSQYTNKVLANATHYLGGELL